MPRKKKGKGEEKGVVLAVVGFLVVVEAHLDDIEHGLGRDGDLVALESLGVRRLRRVGTRKCPAGETVQDQSSVRVITKVRERGTNRSFQNP